MKKKKRLKQKTKKNVYMLKKFLFSHATRKKISINFQYFREQILSVRNFEIGKFYKMSTLAVGTEKDKKKKIDG